MAEKSGLVQRITVIDGEPDRYEVDPQPLLDIGSDVSSGNEQGLLDIAFSDDGAHLYVSYTDAAGDNVIDRYSMSGSSIQLESRTEILQVDQPFSNHNGGGITFGPDGFTLRRIRRRWSRRRSPRLGSGSGELARLHSEDRSQRSRPTTGTTRFPTDQPVHRWRRRPGGVAQGGPQPVAFQLRHRRR